MSRLRRESRLLAALNHPNIAAIYGLAESAGVPALVLELVEGPTLAERLQQGPLSIDETLDVARRARGSWITCSSVRPGSATQEGNMQNATCRR